MKKMVIAGLMIGAVLCADAAQAQETEGLIPRLIRKWKGGDKAQAKTKTPATTIPRQPSALVGAEAPRRDASASAPKGDQADGEPQKTVVPRIASMTKEELLKDLYDELEGEDEVFAYIPGLGMHKDLEGKSVFTYVHDKEAKDLSDLDAEILRGLLTRVRQTATKINTDRIQKQLETIRQTQRMMTVQPPQPPPRPPQIPQQPTVPRTPPQPPPQPPRR